MDGGIEIILGELIEMVQATAPTLWAIAQRQVVANTIGSGVWAGLCILLAVVLAKIARHSLRSSQGNTYDTGWDVALVFSAFFACIAVVLALGCLNSLVMYSVNPDYYAIKVLLQLVR